MKSRTKPIIVGHRGSRGLKPENSIKAFSEALKLGALGLEMDLFITKDGKVVVTHDATISNQLCVTAAGNTLTEQESERLKIYQLRLEQIKPFDCGSKPDPLFPEQEDSESHIPLLSDVIEAASQYPQGNDLQYFLEIKSDAATDEVYHPEPRFYVQQVLRVIEEKNIQNQAVIISFDKRALKEAKEQNKQISIGLSVDSGESLDKQFEELGFVPDVVCPLHSEVQPELLQFAREQGFRLIAWTVNEPDDIRRMIQLGVDGIITDYPNKAMEQLR